MKLHVSSAIMQDIADYCRSQLPAEACGVLLGTWTRPDGECDSCRIVQWRAMRNIAADPSQAFAFAPEEWVPLASRLHFGCEDELTLVGVFHSHPASPAVPSFRDAEGWLASSAWSIWIVSFTAPGEPVVRAYHLRSTGELEQLQIQKTAT